MTDAEILRQVGANIRKARVAANLTQEGLAELADIHWKTLGYIESGKRDFGVTIFTRLASCLNLSEGAIWAGLVNDSTTRNGLLKKAVARKRKPR